MRRPRPLPTLLLSAALASCAASPQDVQQLLLPDQFHVTYGTVESDIDNRMTPSRGFDEEGDVLEFGLTWDLSEPRGDQRGLTRADLVWLVEQMRPREAPAATPPPPEEPPPEAAEAPAEPTPPVEVAPVVAAPQPEEILPPPEEPAPEPAPEETPSLALEEAAPPPDPPADPVPVEAPPPVVEEPPKIDTVLPAASIEPQFPRSRPAEEDSPWGELALAATAGLAGVLVVVLAAKFTPRTAAS